MQHRLSFRLLFRPALWGITSPELIYCLFHLTSSKYWFFWSKCCHNFWMTNRFLHWCNKQCGFNTMGPLPSNVHNDLHIRFGQQWFRHDGPIPWPARLPDLSCLDFFLWGHIKTMVHDTPVDSGEELVAWIAVAAREILDIPEIFRTPCT